MRVVKLVCCLGLVTVLSVVWRTHGQVVAAYTEERPPTELRLTGSDLAFEPTPIEPSPFAVGLVPPDLRGVAVATTPGVETPSPIPTVGGGTAELAGTVNGPDGPVAGAVVLLERHVGGHRVEARVSTGDDGTWRVRSLLGGRFRVRAFVPDRLADPEPQVFFLADGEVRALRFSLQAADPSVRVSLHASAPHFVGLVVPTAVTVGRETVDAEGRWVLRPSVGARVVVSATGAASTAASGSTTTDTAGVAHFGLVCDTPGPAQIRVMVTDEATSAVSTSVVDLPPCQSLPDPEALADGTTTSPPPTSVAGDG